MIRIPIYQVDAFTSRLFGGNPAAVCPLDDWLPEEQMQAIAAENNLSETAFFAPEGGAFGLRWFTPLVEVDLCGHATLATAHVLFAKLGFEGESVAFQTKSGKLVVKRDGDKLAMDFPASSGVPCDPHPDLIPGLGRAPEAVFAARDYLAVYSCEQEVRNLQPDMERLTRIDRRGVIVTAPGRDCDFVSRFFAPAVGIPEDPVTGSAHCTLTPYWSKRLRKSGLFARQVSKRGGELWCTDCGGRVQIAGQAVCFLEGTIEV